MLLVTTWAISLMLWVILWAVGVKALDAFMLVIAIMVGAVAIHIVLPLLPGRRSAGMNPPGRPPFGG